MTVVVDTEEEFDWSAPFDPNATPVENIERQPLAQTIFDRYGVVPTYVIDYPVASSASARAVLRSISDAGKCEIGAHLHPWVNPPHEGPVDDYHSFPGNLPESSERAKLTALTECIEEGFRKRPIIYKAGRYGIGRSTAKILADLGFRIDVSVVPLTDFSPSQGADFTKLPAGPFETEHGIIALPLSVNFTGALATAGRTLYPAVSGRLGSQLHVPGILSRLNLLERLRLSPEGHTLDDMIRQTRAAIDRGQRFFMLTYHSSSLLPAAAPYVRSEADLRAFLSTIESYISFFLHECRGRTAAVSSVANVLAGG